MSSHSSKDGSVESTPRQGSGEPAVNPHDGSPKSDHRRSSSPESERSDDRGSPRLDYDEDDPISDKDDGADAKKSSSVPITEEREPEQQSKHPPVLAPSSSPTPSPSPSPPRVRSHVSVVVKQPTNKDNIRHSPIQWDRRDSESRDHEERGDSEDERSRSRDRRSGSRDRSGSEESRSGSRERYRDSRRRGERKRSASEGSEGARRKRRNERDSGDMRDERDREERERESSHGRKRRHRSTSRERQRRDRRSRAGEGRDGERKWRRSESPRGRDRPRRDRGDGRDSDEGRRARGSVDKKFQDEVVEPPKPKKEPLDLLKTRTGGAYIPPAKLKMMQEQIADKNSEQYQRLNWERLKKKIHGQVNKANGSNLVNVVRDLLQENIIRGKGLLARSIIQAQSFSPTFSNVYAALVAVINSKFPNIGELILRRLIVQFKRSFRRNDKAVTLTVSKFIAHLVNQQVAHEILALELMILLLENPTDDSVEVTVAFLKECGAKLTELSPKGINSIFDQLRDILSNASKFDKRVQYMLEVLFAVRKDHFQAYPSMVDELDLINEDDQITHTITLEDAVNPENELNVFKLDAEFTKNEEMYDEIRREIIGEPGESSDEEDEDEAASGEEGADAEDDKANEPKMTIIDNTEQNLVAFRRLVYLTINSSLDFQEAAHKLLKLELKAGQDVEMCNMIVDCCAQQRTYENFYGLLAERFCRLKREFQETFERVVRDAYCTIHRFEITKLRNIARLTAHLLSTDAISWNVLGEVSLNEEDTTSAGRIFIKIVFQELAEFMSVEKLMERIRDPTMQSAFEKIFPRDNPNNTRFSINFFTSIGLGYLTMDLRKHLQQAHKKKLKEAEDSSSSSSSDSDDSDSSDSDSSDSSDSSSSSSASDSSEDEKKKKKGKNGEKRKRKKKHDVKQEEPDESTEKENRLPAVKVIKQEPPSPEQSVRQQEERGEKDGGRRAREPERHGRDRRGDDRELGDRRHGDEERRGERHDDGRRRGDRRDDEGKDRARESRRHRDDGRSREHGNGRARDSQSPEGRGREEGREGRDDRRRRDENREDEGMAKEKKERHGREHSREESPRRGRREGKDEEVRKEKEIRERGSEKRHGRDGKEDDSGRKRDERAKNKEKDPKIRRDEEGEGDRKKEDRRRRDDNRNKQPEKDRRRREEDSDSEEEDRSKQNGKSKRRQEEESDSEEGDRGRRKEKDRRRRDEDTDSEEDDRSRRKEVDRRRRKESSDSEEDDRNRQKEKDRRLREEERDSRERRRSREEKERSKQRDRSPLTKKRERKDSPEERRRGRNRSSSMEERDSKRRRRD